MIGEKPDVSACTQKGDHVRMQLSKKMCITAKLSAVKSTIASPHHKSLLWVLCVKKWIPSNLKRRSRTDKYFTNASGNYI